jgi:hypothetical protein
VLPPTSSAPLPVRPVPHSVLPVPLLPLVSPVLSVPTFRVPTVSSVPQSALPVPQQQCVTLVFLDTTIHQETVLDALLSLQVVSVVTLPSVSTAISSTVTS